MGTNGANAAEVCIDIGVPNDKDNPQSPDDSNRVPDAMEDKVEESPEDVNNCSPACNGEQRLDDSNDCGEANPQSPEGLLVLPIIHDLLLF